MSKETFKKQKKAKISLGTNVDEYIWGEWGPSSVT